MSEPTPEELIRSAFKNAGEFPPAVDSWWMTLMVGKHLCEAIAKDRAAAEERGRLVGWEQARDKMRQLYVQWNAEQELFPHDETLRDCRLELDQAIAALKPEPGKPAGGKP